MSNGNINRPKKGSVATVEPIRNVRDIASIKKLLAGKPRDLALFVVGINTNLRASDLVRIRVADVRGQDELLLREKKTGNMRRITLNMAVGKVLAAWLAESGLQDQNYLFPVRRRDGWKQMAANYIHKLVKAWTGAINLQGRYGSHSLRKTWGFHQRVTYGVDIPTLMVAYGHSTQRQTLDYLCIQGSEIRDAYMNEI